ncbi:homocysteine S-methyltransferase family protein [Akkermansiaceae bacterium]|nr:homocysteine S-methyltransferase family protein [Akkermansiaceae bacterium]
MTPNLSEELKSALRERILVLDGAMGTTIRSYELCEADARGERFQDNNEDLLNNGDILSITQPSVIGDIHKRFYEAGSDICETNTFSGTVLAQSEFFVQDPRKSGGIKDPEFFDKKVINNTKLQDLVHELNVKSVQLAKEQADRVSQNDGRKRYVAGAIGPPDCFSHQRRRSKRHFIPPCHLRSGQTNLPPPNRRSPRRRLRYSHG